MHERENNRTPVFGGRLDPWLVSKARIKAAEMLGVPEPSDTDVLRLALAELVGEPVDRYTPRRGRPRKEVA